MSLIAKVSGRLRLRALIAIAVWALSSWLCTAWMKSSSRQGRRRASWPRPSSGTAQPVDLEPRRVGVEVGARAEQGHVADHLGPVAASDETQVDGQRDRHRARRGPRRPPAKASGALGELARAGRARGRRPVMPALRAPARPARAAAARPAPAGSAAAGGAARRPAARLRRRRGARRRRRRRGCGARAGCAAPRRRSGRAAASPSAKLIFTSPNSSALSSLSDWALTPTVETLVIGAARSLPRAPHGGAAGIAGRPRSHTGPPRDRRRRRGSAAARRSSRP